jgi:predicted nucleotidyltransferase
MGLGVARPWGFHRDVTAIRAVLGEVVRRIVDATDPDEIILFGSTVRGRLRRHSDFDLLIVKPGVDDRRRLIQRLHAHLFGLPMPVDVVVVTPEEVQEARGHTFTFLARALRGGRSIYRRRVKGTHG